MNDLILTTSSRTLLVVNNGTSLSISDQFGPIGNAGQFICCLGGVKAILDRCVVGDYKAELAKIEAKEAAKKASREEEKEEKFNSYKRIFSEEVTETTVESVSALIYELKNTECNDSNMPRMTIGYSCNKYKLGEDEETEVTIKLVKPILFNGEFHSKFTTNCRKNYLTKYTHLS